MVKIILFGDCAINRHNFLFLLLGRLDDRLNCEFLHDLFSKLCATHGTFGVGQNDTHDTQTDRAHKANINNTFGNKARGSEIDVALGTEIYMWSQFGVDAV